MKFPWLFPTLLALGLLLSARTPAAAQELGDKVAAPGLFSFQAPKGWKVVGDNPASKFPLAMDAPRDGFAANINVVQEAFAGSMADYVANNIAALKATPLFTDVKLGVEEPMTTADGTKGIHLSATDTLGKLKLAQHFYFFEGPAGQKLVITCSSLATDAARCAPLFAASLQTFARK